MANEEIVVKFGGDLGPLGSAIRGIKGMMSNAADSIKDSFKDVFRHLTAPLSLAGAFEAVKSLTEMAETIKRISESTGLDTGVTQDILNLGKASGVASGEIESMLDKFVKGLAPGSDPEQALMAIADRMAAIEDPSERARLAVEAFGKSGVKLIPILAQGADGVRKLSEEWGKLDAVQIDLMEHTNQQLEKAGSKSKVLLAQWIEGVKATAEKFEKEPLWKKILLGPLALPGAIRDAAKDTTPDQPAIVTSKPLPTPAEQNKAKIDAAIAAAKKIADEEAFIYAKPQEKVLMLTRQILAVRREIEDTSDAEEQQKLGEKMVSLEEKRKSISDGIAASDKARLEKEKALTEQILQARKQVVDTSAEMMKATANAQYGSLEEIARSGFSFFQGNRWQFRQGPNSGEAQQILDSESRAKSERIWGNIEDAKRDESYAEKLRQDLSERGIIAPNDIKQLTEKMSAVEGHLSKLLAQSTGEGLIVKGPGNE